MAPDIGEGLGFVYALVFYSVVGFPALGAAAGAITAYFMPATASRFVVAGMVVGVASAVLGMLVTLGLTVVYHVIELDLDLTLETGLWIAMVHCVVWTLAPIVVLPLHRYLIQRAG